MRLPGSAADTAILSTILFPIFSAAVGNIDCTRVVVNKIPFNLKELGGARSVVHSVDLGPSHTNTTYTIDICKPLGKAKDVNKDDQCPHGTRGRSLTTCRGICQAWSRALLIKIHSLCD